MSGETGDGTPPSDPRSAADTSQPAELLTVPGPTLLEARQVCADQVIEPYPTAFGWVSHWDESAGDGQPAAHRQVRIEVTRGLLRHRWTVALPTAGPAVVIRTGHALTCRAAWARAGAELPLLTAAQWDEVAVRRRGVTDLCGVTADVPLLIPGDDGHSRTRVFVCDREAGHGGTNHAGPLLHPGPGDICTAEWPVTEPPAPRELTPDIRYARLPEARGPYRVGRKVPHHVYRQLTDEPSDDDVSLFDAVRADLAAQAAEALNARSTPTPGPYTTDFALYRATAAEVEVEQDRVRELTAEVERLSAALMVCEEALHLTAVVGGTNPHDEAASAALHAAQQASGAYQTDWEPGQQARDDAGLAIITEPDPPGS